MHRSVRCWMSGSYLWLAISPTAGPRLRDGRRRGGRSGTKTDLLASWALSISASCCGMEDYTSPSSPPTPKCPPGWYVMSSSTTPPCTRSSNSANVLALCDHSISELLHLVTAKAGAKSRRKHLGFGFVYTPGPMATMYLSSAKGPSCTQPPPVYDGESASH